MSRRSTAWMDGRDREFWLGENYTPPLPDAATDALPGTEAKMRVMQERIAAGRQPHHPDDARWELT